MKFKQSLVLFPRESSGRLLALGPAQWAITPANYLCIMLPLVEIRELARPLVPKLEYTD